jgi:predicted RNA-binding protein Jag
MHQAQIKADTDRAKAADVNKIGELDQVTSELMQQAQQVSQVLQQVMEQLKSIASLASAKKRVIKKGGKAAAIELVGEDGSVLGSQQIVRGKDGSIEGTA